MQPSTDSALIASCRLQAGITREELANRLGVKEHLVDLWESPGYEGIDLPLIRRVAAATGRRVEISFTATAPAEAPAVVVQGRSKVARVARAGQVAALLLLAALGTTSCITETESSLRRPAAGTMKTQGVIIQGGLEETWAHVQESLSSMTREPLYNRGVEKSIRTTVSGTEVSVLVEPYDQTKTVIHVNSPSDDVAEYVRMRLLRR